MKILNMFRKRKPFGNYGLTREKNKNSNNMNYWIYYCKCGEKLVEGPEGSASVNAVCKKCMINYGCLPGFWMNN